MNDFWPDFDMNEQDTQGAIKMLRAHALSLKSKTNGVVKATFSKIEYNTRSLEVAAGIGKAIAEQMTVGSEILEEELKDKKDGNALFQTETYKFEIYNNTYRFRVFTLECKPVYPISIRVDEGIRNEMNLNAVYCLEDENELIDVVRGIFGSQKLRYIINSMLKMK